MAARKIKPGRVPQDYKQSVQRPFRLHRVLEDLLPQLRLGTQDAKGNHRPERDRELLKRLVFQALALAEEGKTNSSGPNLYVWEPPDDLGRTGKQRGLFFYPHDAERIEKFIRGSSDTNSSIMNRLCWLGALFVIGRLDALSHSSEFWQERRQRWAEMDEEINI